MTKYPRGRDIAVNWTLDLGGSAVDLAACDLLFEYHTGAGSKSVPRSAYTIYNNVLSWTFHGEDQIAYGVYGLRLVAASGSEEYVFHQEGAFEIIHGEVSDEEQTLPLESSVETEQEPAEEEEEQETGTPVYVSSSPIHVEKVPLGSNITVRWRLLTTAEFDFDLAECDLYLYYAAAGSGFRAATNYELSTENGYVLTWNFAAAEQIRFGLYSLLLDVRRNGAKIATLVKDDAFSLVHRKGSIFPDRIIDFESIVTTMGGGALYTLIDVNNDGYSTVYRSDGVTPAQVDDLIIYDGNLWYAIDAGSLSAIRGLRNDFASLELTTEGIFARVTDLEGDLGELWLTAREFGVRMSDAEGYIGQLTLTAREFEVRMSDAEGNIGQLTLTSQQFGVRMSDAEGNIGQLTLTSQLFDVRMSDVEGNVGELMLTSEEFGVRMTNAEGSIGQLTLTAEQFAVRMSDTEGNVSLLQQTATSLTSQIQDAQGNISTLQQTATSLTSRIQNAEGSISTIAQTAESIQLQVDNQHGDIAALEVSARAITSRVSDAEGNISILEQTATSLTSQIEDAEGNISTLQQTAASLTSQIEDAEGNISTLQQTATQISSRVTSIEGEFGEGGRVTVAESTIVQQAGLIATKVSQTDYDANNQAISTHFSTIEQTASQISTRVAAVESEFGEGGRVTVAESTIVQQAGLIATKVSQTDYDANNQAISTRFSSIEQTAGEISASVTNVSNNLSTYEALTDAVLTNLQDQIDGVVETWYAEGTPTLSNYPVNTWAQADYPNHIGDLYYDKLTGKAYRFMLDDEQDPAVYVWVELADEDIAKALALAGEKRRVFVSTPYAPYDAGDLWVKERTVNGETTREIYRCKRSRAAGETIDLANDWVPADDYAVTVNKANLKILADAIVGEVAAFTYDSEGKISSASKSNITQTADAIRLSVSNQAIGTALGEGGSINDALLDTGIDITNGDITLTANHILLQNQSAVSGLELTTIGTGANQRVVIDVDSLNVHGIFTTTAWSDKEQALQGYADSAAGDAYTDAVAQAATDAASYITTNVAPLITTAQNTANAAQTAADNAQSAVNGLGYLAAALENGTTAIGGGLILSSLIGLGGNSGSGGAWELWSGVNGQYDTRTEEQGGARGHGIAAWFGGPMVDHLQYPSETNYAASLFRMDGSGYLAGGEIQWGASGELIIHGTSTENPISIENAVLTQGNLSVTISDLIALKSWFTVESWTDSSGTHNYLKLNASNTGLEGFVSDGFISAGGLSPSSGTGGADLPAVWTSLRNVSTSASEINNTIKINALHIPIGSGLDIDGNGLIYATNTGTLSSVSLAQGATNGTLHLVVNGTAQSDVAVTGLGSLAYKSSLVASDIPDLSATYQPKDADLTAIAGLTGTSGFLKKTAANTWSLDTNTYLTGITSTMVTNALGYTPANVTALADYVTLATAQTISGLKTITSGLRISGRAYSAGDDEGIVITWAGNDFATVSLGSHNSERSTFTIHRGSAPYWRYNNGTSAYNIAHPAKSGTIALTSDVSTAIEALDSSTEAVSSGYFLTGVTITDGKITARTQSNSISGSAGSLTTVSKTAWGRTYWTSGGVPDNVSGDMDDVGKMTFTAKTSKSTSGNVLEVVTIDGVTYLHSVLPFVSDSFISAGGVSSGGGSGGIDPSAMWAYLTNTASDTTYNNTKIAASHIPDVASTYGYLKSADLSGYVTLAGTETISGLKTFTSGLRVSGRAYSGGDDEGIVIGWAANAYATISLGSHNAERSTFSIHQGEAPKWVYNNGTTGYTITHPAKTGTIALTSDIPNVPSWAMASTKPSYTFAEITDKITHTNEFNFVPDAYDSYVYFNYRSSADTAVNVTKYIFSNGSATTGGRASVEASSFIKYGGTSAQFLKADGSVDSSTYLTGNQTITLSGDVSGSGATSISVSIGSGKVTNAMLAGSIANSKLSNSSITINGSSTSLGGSFSTASITAGTAGQSGASTGVSFSIPYVTMNKYGIVTAYGTHSHTISASDLTTTIGSTTYAPYNSAGYLPLSGGTLSNAAWGEALIINRASAGGESAIKFTSNGTLVGVIGVKTTMTPVFYPGNETSGSGYTIYHSGNSNKSDVAWTCSTLYASANVMAGAGAEGIYMNGTGICWHNSSNVWASDIIGFTSSGNVGIGTTAPAYKLDVNGTARFVESTPHIMRYYSAGTYTTGWYYGTNGNEALAFVANNAVTSFMFVQGASTKLDSWTNSTWTGVAPAMQIKQNCVYINSLIASGVSPSYQLYVNGNAVASGAITAGAASDARLKTNISTLSDSKAKALIMALRPVSFTWNDKATELYDQYKGDDLGFVAQEVENVLPIAIGTIFEKYKRLDQTKFIAPLVAVAKDHETRIEKLERENKELRKEVERLRMN